MNIDFYRPDQWIELAELLESQFEMDSEQQMVRPFMGVGHALGEITQGLTKLFPTRKTIFYAKSMNPFIEPHAMNLAREGYKTLPVEQKDFLAPDKIVESVERDALFILLPVDDPLLGYKFPIDALIKALNEKKIFKIFVDHQNHQYAPVQQVLERQEIRIHSIDAHRALAFLGARARIRPLVADDLNWSEFHTSDLHEHYGQKLETQKINEFESQPIEGALPILHGHTRVADKVVLTFEDLDGHALIAELAKILGFQLQPPGRETRLETTSLSRWGGLKTMDYLKALNFTPNQIRGCILIDQSLIDSQLKNHLIQARNQVLKFAKGTA